MNIFDHIRTWINKVGTYRITSDLVSCNQPMFIIEVRGLFQWHTVKVFTSNDIDYARNCAYELLDKLEEKID